MKAKFCINQFEEKKSNRNQINQQTSLWNELYKGSKQE